MQYSSQFAVVTCKRCLKLIGAQQPSGAATDRASAVKPVERRATVAASDLPTVLYLHLGIDHRFGQDYVRIWDASLEPKDGLEKFARGDASVSPQQKLEALESMVNCGGGEFARIATDINDNGTTDWWFECHKCGELIEGTANLTDDEANGNLFRCACGQEYIGSTHIMLHAIEAARRGLSK